MLTRNESFRAEDAVAPLQLRFDTFELNEAEARLTRDGRPIALPPRAFAVLCALARRPGQLVTKNALLDAVWGHQHVSESVLKTVISELRSALSDDPKQPRYIETASRRGYRFIGVLEAARARSATGLPRVPDLELPNPRPTTSPLVGRLDALARLRAAWQEAGSGRRQIVWIAGEAGIGKSTLIDHFVAGLGPVVCAHGQCVEQHGAGEPYLPVLEALAALTRIDPTLSPLLRAVAPTWLLQLPWLSGEDERAALRRELAGVGQERMLRELGELLDRYARERPLLLVTEDLHWSDQATVHAINHVARRRGPARLLWLASFRLAEVIAEEHPLNALRHELKLHRLASEILLEPFSESEVADYVATRLAGGDTPEVFVRSLHARTDGLPLFVVNVVDELTSQGAQLPTTAASVAELEVPESLAGVISRQIDRLSPEERELLQAASVCGVEFRPATAAEALERDETWASERCDELARRQQWLASADVARLPDGSIDARYSFRHALYRHVFYQRIGATLRARLHRRVARSLERSREAGITVTAAELALHYEQCHDLITALRHYAAAAENALRRFAPAEAMNLTAHALEVLPRCAEGRERDEIELELLAPRAVAASQLLGTTTPEATAAFERIDALGESLPDKSKRVLEIELGWVLQARGEYGASRALAARKVALAERRGDRLLCVSACNLMGATLFFQGELSDSRRWLEQGLAAFDEVADRAVQTSSVMDPAVSLHARLGRALSHLGLIQSARSHTDTALELAERRGQPYGRCYALAQAGLLAIRLDDPERALQFAIALQKTVRDHAVVEAEGYMHWLRGWALARLGEPEAGLELILQGYASHLRLDRIGAGCAAVLGYAAEALLRMGRQDDARTRLDDALALARRIGERVYLPDLLVLEARLALGRGEVQNARAALDQAQREAREQQALWLELTALVALCELDGAAREDLAALADARTRLLEGADTALAQHADAVLRERRIRRPSGSRRTTG